MLHKKILCASVYVAGGFGNVASAFLQKDFYYIGLDGCKIFSQAVRLFSGITIKIRRAEYAAIF